MPAQAGRGGEIQGKSIADQKEEDFSTSICMHIDVSVEADWKYSRSFKPTSMASYIITKKA